MGAFADPAMSVPTEHADGVSTEDAYAESPPRKCGQLCVVGHPRI